MLSSAARAEPVLQSLLLCSASVERLVLIVAGQGRRGVLLGVAGQPHWGLLSNGMC